MAEAGAVDAARGAADREARPGTAAADGCRGGGARSLDERAHRGAGKALIRRIGIVVAILALIAGCSTKGSEETPKRVTAAESGGRDARAGPRDRQRGLHLRLSDGRQLPRAVFVLRQQGGPGVQGRLERNPQHRTGLHARGYRDPDTELRYAVLGGGRGPAGRAAGADRPADRAGPLLLTAVRRRLHIQLRLRRQPHHRQRRWEIPSRRAELERRQARRRQRGHSFRYRPRVGALPHPTVRPLRSRQRQEDPGRLPGAAAVGVSQPAAPAARARRSTSCRR